MAVGGVRQRTRIRPTVTVSGSGTGPAGPNTPPVWQSVADFTFIEGIPQNYSVASRVSDPGGSVAFVNVNSGTLPAPRLTFNTSTFAYVYSGGAGPLTATSYTLIATDNGGLSAFSNSHNIIIQAVSFATPTPPPSFAAGAVADYPVSGFIPGFDSSRDVVTRDASGVALPAWLTLTGPGGSILHTNGTQVAADTLPGLRLRVTRNGGPFAICNSFTVTVTAVVTSIFWQKISIGNTGTGEHNSSYGSMVERNGAGRLWTYFITGQFFSPTANTWSPATGGIGKRENAYYAHDTVHNVFWSPDCLALDNPSFAGTVYFNPASPSFTAVVPAGTGASPPGDAGGGIDPIRQCLYAFGGFFPGGSPPSGSLRKLDITTLTPTAWVSMGATGDIPSLFEANAATGYTHYRGGVDTRNGNCWVIGDGRELWWYEPLDNKWRLITTTGPKPPEFCICSLDESRNKIICHTGYNAINDFSNKTDQTHILDLSTCVWTLSVTGTANTPQASEDLPGFRLDYDDVRKRVLYNGWNTNTGFVDVWEIKYPTSDELSIPIRTFVARGMSATLGYGAWCYATPDVGKQSIWLNDIKRRRVVTMGGDYFGLGYSNASDPHGQAAQCEIWAYNPVNAGDAQLGWNMVSPWTLGPGTITPGRPNDGNPWVHDTKRDRYWTVPGGWGTGGEFSTESGRHGSTTNQSGRQSNPLAIAAIPGGTYYVGLMWMNPDTGIWTGVTNANIGSPYTAYGAGATSCLHPGIYDPKQDAIYCLEGSQDLVVRRIFLSDTDSAITASRVNVPTGIGTTSPVAGDYPVSVALQTPCFDLLSRKCYLLTVRTNFNTGFPVGYVLLRFDMDNPAAGCEVLATPPFQSPVLDPAGTGGACQIYFDTRNRVVLWPKKQSPEGIVENMCVYRPAQNDWQTFPTTFATGGMQQGSPPLDPTPVGNNGVYDQTHNCIILGGSTDNPNFTRGFIYLWRYQ